MPLTDDIPTGDSEFLDWVFERALEDYEQGRTVDPASLGVGHEHLSDEVNEAVALARRVAVGRSATAPTLSGYTILGELGRGGMGTVFLARQERLGGRLVAVKILPQAVALSERARERFRSEARAIAKLRHPNIVAVHDVIEERGIYAYAMELVDGPSLAQAIEGRLRDQGALLVRESLLEPSPRGIPSPDARVPDRNPVKSGTEKGFSVQHAPLDPSGVSRIGIAIARALGEVHRAGLLHRDVKPSNILLRRDGTPLLSDFGLARETESPLTVTAHFVGTPAYAAPEQLRAGGEKLDARTDVYALGVTLYHALALRMPFGGRSSADVLRQIEAGRAEPLRKANPRLPRDLETIVAKAMDPDPARRYQTADELADDLERLLSLQPIKARPAGVVTRTLKLARRNRRSVAAAVIGAAAALTAAVAGVVYWFLAPGWAAAHLREARLALLDPNYANALFTREYWREGSSRGRSAAISAGALDKALEAYDAALRWSPFDESIRAEREIVRAARDQGTDAHLSRDRDQGGAPAFQAGGQSARTSSPSSNTESTRSAGDESVPHPRGVGHPQFHSVPGSLKPLVPTPEDLRKQGLGAYLSGDIESAIDAWTRLDAVAEPGPMVEAALGILFLVREEPARAYPRLRDAVQAFPNVGFLTTYLADAAVQCGDLEKAGQLIASARTKPMLDPQGGLDRVEADWMAASGQFDRARSLYETRPSPIARTKLAAMLEKTGDLDGAIRQCALAMSEYGGSRVRGGFTATADRWWESKSVPQRRALMRAALAENPFDRDSFVGLLRAYVEAQEGIDRMDAPSPRSGEGEPRPVGTPDNSPAFQRWVNGRQRNRSPVGTTETSAVPDGTAMMAATREPSDESLGYSHAVPPARTRFRLFDFSTFQARFPGARPPLFRSQPPEGHVDPIGPYSGGTRHVTLVKNPLVSPHLQKVPVLGMAVASAEAGDPRSRSAVCGGHIRRGDNANHY